MIKNDFISLLKVYQQEKEIKSYFYVQTAKINRKHLKDR